MADLDALREQLDEEGEAKSDLQRLLSRANAEAQSWRLKYESEGMTRSEELEEIRRKLTIKLQESENSLEGASSKINGLEKTKSRLQLELEDAVVNSDRASSMVNQLEKRVRSFDKNTADWQTKVRSIQTEFENVQKECRSYSAELYRSKTQYEESITVVETLRRENCNLTGLFN